MENEEETFDVIQWCTAVLGPVTVLADHSREHAGMRAGAFHLQAGDGLYYVKIHHDRLHWEQEVHAYEHWTAVLGNFAPRLKAVHAIQPLALIISDLQGTVLERTPVSPEQRIKTWQAAGDKLRILHASRTGTFFGIRHQDGTPVGKVFTDAVDYMKCSFDDWLERGRQLDCLTEVEMAVIFTAVEMLPAFSGEVPVPCHYDYCPANWVINAAGNWCGVIDFEFSRWDVRTADFSRFPDWDWIEHPELLDAMISTYGCTRDRRFEQQLFVSLVLYALTAVVWGMEVGYHGFAAEGHRALAVLSVKDGTYGP